MKSVAHGRLGCLLLRALSHMAVASHTISPVIAAYTYDNHEER